MINLISSSDPIKCVQSGSHINYKYELQIVVQHIDWKNKIIKKRAHPWGHFSGEACGLGRLPKCAFASAWDWIGPQVFLTPEPEFLTAMLFWKKETEYLLDLHIVKVIANNVFVTFYLFGSMKIHSTISYTFVYLKYFIIWKLKHHKMVRFFF